MCMWTKQMCIRNKERYMYTKLMCTRINELNKCVLELK